MPDVPGLGRAGDLQKIRATEYLARTLAYYGIWESYASVFRIATEQEGSGCALSKSTQSWHSQKHWVSMVTCVLLIHKNIKFKSLVRLHMLIAPRALTWSSRYLPVLPLVACN